MKYDYADIINAGINSDDYTFKDAVNGFMQFLKMKFPVMYATIKQNEETFKQHLETFNQHWETFKHGETFNQQEETYRQHLETIKQHEETIKQHWETFKQHEETFKRHFNKYISDCLQDKQAKHEWSKIVILMKLKGNLVNEV